MAINLTGNIIGLDVGSRNIGVARINTFAKLSEPLQHIDLTHQEALEALNGVITEHSAVAVVIGLPRGLDGQETAQTQYCRDFASELKEKIEIPVFLIDEAGTSKEADARKVKGSAISQDSVAASIILEDFVNQKNVEELLV